MSRHPSFRTRQERNTRISRLTFETWARWEWGNRQAKICSNHMVMLCTVGAMLEPCGAMQGHCWGTVWNRTAKKKRTTQAGAKFGAQHGKVGASGCTWLCVAPAQRWGQGRHIARKGRNAPTCCFDHEILQHVSLKATKQRMWILRHPTLLTPQQPHTDRWVHPTAVHRYKINTVTKYRGMTG